MLLSKLQIYKCHSIMYDLNIYIYIYVFKSVLEDMEEWNAPTLSD